MSTSVHATPTTDEAVHRRPSAGDRLTSFMPVIALVAIIAALTVADPDFLTRSSLTAAINTAGNRIVRWRV